MNSRWFALPSKTRGSWSWSSLLLGLIAVGADEVRPKVNMGSSVWPPYRSSWNRACGETVASASALPDRVIPSRGRLWMCALYPSEYFPDDCLAPGRIGRWLPGIKLVRGSYGFWPESPPRGDLREPADPVRNTSSVCTVEVLRDKSVSVDCDMRIVSWCLLVPALGKR